MNQSSSEKVIVEKRSSGQGWENSIGLYLKGDRVVFRFSTDNFIECTYLGAEEEYGVEEYRRAIGELREKGKCVVKSRELATQQLYHDLEIGVSAGAQANVFGSGIYFNFCCGVCCSETVFTRWTVEEISIQ